MDSKLKRKLTVGTAALAAAAFSAGAYAATKDTDATVRQAFLNDVANRLKVSPAELSAALQAAYFDQLDAAVAAGKLTKTRAESIKQKIRRTGLPPMLEGGALLGDRLGGLGHERFRGLFRPAAGRVGGGLAAAAKYLGLTPAQLRDELIAGKTLAQVAKAKGKSTTGLKDAITAAVRSRLDQAVAAKRITGDEEKQMLRTLAAHEDDLINAVHTGPVLGGRRYFGRAGSGTPPVPLPAPPPPGAPPEAPASVPTY
jgi:hypothetical protein